MPSTCSASTAAPVAASAATDERDLDRAILRRVNWLQRHAGKGDAAATVPVVFKNVRRLASESISCDIDDSQMKEVEIQSPGFIP